MFKSIVLIFSLATLIKVVGNCISMYELGVTSQRIDTVLYPVMCVVLLYAIIKKG